MKKKIISLILILTLLSCNTCVFATITNTGSTKTLHNMTTIANWNLGRAHSEIVYGILGKDNGEPIAHFYTAENYNDSSWYAHFSQKSISKNYMIIEANLLFDENVDSFNIGTNQHNAVSNAIYKNSDFQPYQWCNFIMVYNKSAGTTTTYINGEMIYDGYETNFHKTINNTFYSNLRFIFDGTKPGNAWVADMKVYEAENKPAVNRTLYLKGYEHSNIIKVPEGCSYNMIFEPSIADASVKIFVDKSYTATIGKDDMLTDDCRIILETEDEFCVYSINVDDSIFVEDSVNDGTIAFQRATVEQMSGLFGKSAYDTSQKVTADSSMPAFSTYTWLSRSFDGYGRIDFNIEPGNAKNIYIGTNVHKPISDYLSLNSNQWNRISITYDTADFDKTTGTGKATTYVNGVLLGTTDTIFTNLGQIRIIFSGGEGSYIYVDDFNFTLSERKVLNCTKSDELSEGANVYGDFVLHDGSTKVSQLGAKENLSSVRVYADNTYAEQLSGDATLSTGNAVVVESDECVYRYYTVYDISSKKILRTIDDAGDDFSLTRADKEGVKGLGGKAADDESIKITVTGADNDANGYNDWKWTNDGYTGFLAVEFNVYPVSAYPSINTGGHKPIAPSVSGLVKNRWNKVVMYYDASSYNGSTGTSYLYVNGKYVGMYTSAQFTSGNYVRIIANSEIDNGGYLYIDDYTIYEMDVPPLATVPDISSHYRVSDGVVSFDGNLTPADISVNNYKIRVYTDNTYTEQIAQNKLIKTGYELVAEDSSNTITYYTVNNDLSKNLLMTANDTNIPEELILSGADISGKNGVFGRENADESIKLTLTSSPAYAGYEYNEENDKRYVVMEASAYTNSDGQYKFTTAGNMTLSAGATVADDTGLKEQWMRLVFVFDKQLQVGCMYVNGQNTGYVFCTAFLDDTHKEIRMMFEGNTGDEIYIDDIAVYECDVRPVIAQAAVIPQSIAYIMFNSDLYLPSDIRYSHLENAFEPDEDITQIKIYKDGQAIEPDADGKIPDNSIISLKKNDNVYTSYNVHITPDNQAFFYGAMSRGGVLENGTLKMAVPVENVNDMPKIIVAGYRGGELVYVQTAQTQENSRYITHELDIVNSEYDTVKIMVWKNSNLMPYSKNASMSK